MQRNLIAALAASSLLALAGTASADGYGRGVMVDMNASVAGSNAAAMGAMASTKMVGGAEMYPTKDIIDNAVNSKDHTTLVAAVKAADLVSTLKGAGPFTVFAPTNEAFAKLPAGTVESLLKPENKGKLQQILTYHVVPGRLSAADIADQIKAGNGKAELKTAHGGTLWALMSGNDIMLKDENGNTSKITISNVGQSNG